MLPHGRSYAIRIFCVCAILGAIGAQVTTQDPCGYSSCIPLSYKPGLQADATFDVQIDASASGSVVTNNHITAVISGGNLWSEWLSNYSAISRSIDYTTGTGDIHIVVVADDQLPSPAVNDTNGVGLGNIFIRQSKWDDMQDQFGWAQLQGIMAHEFGHSFGMENTPTYCPESDSIMNGDASYEFGFSTLGGCDQNAMRAKYPRNETPIIIDLDGNGIRLTAPVDGPRFDLDGDGFAEKHSWPEPGDALLVLDRNNNGVIDDGGELFGNYTRLSTGELPANGYEALREFDANADGIISPTDPVYLKLRVWTDLNMDGVSEPAEMRTLPEWT